MWITPVDNLSDNPTFTHQQAKKKIIFTSKQLSKTVDKPVDKPVDK